MTFNSALSNRSTERVSLLKKRIDSQMNKALYVQTLGTEADSIAEINEEELMVTSRN